MNMSTSIRKLIESTLVSLDGVIESPERWSVFDDEATQLAIKELDKYDAFLMGRVTYGLLREYWAISAAIPTSTRSTSCPSASRPIR